jgi:hypothetical protein
VLLEWISKDGEDKDVSSTDSSASRDERPGRNGRSLASVLTIQF